jgi:hypothetical protein
VTYSLIAAITSKSARHSAEVYRTALGNYRSKFFVDGIWRRQADAFTASEEEALSIALNSVTSAENMAFQLTSL